MTSKQTLNYMIVGSSNALYGDTIYRCDLCNKCDMSYMPNSMPSLKSKRECQLCAEYFAGRSKVTTA